MTGNIDSKAPAKSNSYPPWAPRIWSGLRPRDHWDLLAENQFSIHPSRYPMTGLVSIWSLFNAGMSLVQKITHQKRIDQTEIAEPPIFIIGHWRSGTTLLHELLSLDSNFAYPSNLETFVPHHFLVSQPVVKPLLRWLLPGKRPMDNMSVAPDLPQEDEFALLLLGAASHYRRMGFPATTNEYFRYLDSQNLDPHQIEKFERLLRYFFKSLTYKHGRRLVLKSPPHTGRIRSLANWFPGAKFVHISRDPFDVVPSTMRLWKIADDVHAYQKRRYSDVELLDYICRCKDVMYAAYHRDKVVLSENQLVEVRFGDLTANPVDTIRSIYESLELDGFGQLEKAIEENFSNRREHKKNVHNIDSFVDRIAVEWSDYMQWFGYENRSTNDQQSFVA